MTVCTGLRILPILLLACGRAEHDSSSAPAAGGPSATPPATSASTTSKIACPRTGLWALCSVEKRLTASGFVVSYAKEPPRRRDGFSVSPAAYKLGRSHLEVFVYSDSTAARRDLAQLDTLTASPRGSRNQWVTTPTFLHSANLLAVFFTDSPQQAERLTLALTAGAPQP